MLFGSQPLPVLWGLITARCANLSTERWYQAMFTALAEIKTPLPQLKEDALSYLGRMIKPAMRGSSPVCAVVTTARSRGEVIDNLSLGSNIAVA